jgi:hypothetical protein
MTKEQHVAKAVLGHDWTNLEDWVRALDELADLRDEQIERLEGLAPVEGGKQE